MISQAIAQISAGVPKPDKEYIGKDGLMHCAICGQPTQTKVQILDDLRVVRCICQCGKARLLAEEARERMLKIESTRHHCFAGISKHSRTNMIGWTFTADDRTKPKLSDAIQRYAAGFPEFRKEERGLLLFGTVGTGKSFYAAAIANALIDTGIPVLMTNFAILSNQIQATFDGRQEYIDSLQKYDLLVIDDLGAERSSEYMQEIVFNVIDARYRSGLPMIITTNLTKEEFTSPQNTQYARIYDRILERCLPIHVSGGSRRRNKLVEMASDMKRQLGL